MSVPLAPPEPLIEPACPDIYFSAGYGRAAAYPESGSWQLVRHTDKIMIPYVLRTVDAGSRDAASPYGYSGIYVSPDCTPGELADFWARVRTGWRDRGVVTMFFRFSPLDPASVAAVTTLDGLGLTRRADTVTIHVDQGVEHVWAGMEGRSRTAIRKARTAGLYGQIRPVSIEDVRAGSPFRRLYEQTMARVGSAPSYLFPDEYYRLLVEGLGRNLLIAEVRDRQATVVAVALVMVHRDLAHYHLAGSLRRAASDGANNLLVWTILQWAAGNGCARVHLGGGVRADDGLFRFKKSFGGERTPFWTGAVVVDPARYDKLLYAHATATGRSVADIRRSGFFPGYRLG